MVERRNTHTHVSTQFNVWIGLMYGWKGRKERKTSPQI